MVQFPTTKIIDVIKTPDSVESYRIQVEKSGEGDTVAGYPIIERGKDMTSVQIASLTEYLMDRNTYSFGPAKKCLFLPEYAFRITRGNREVVLLLCFSCEELSFVCDGEELLADFDNAASGMRILADELF